MAQAVPTQLNGFTPTTLEQNAQAHFYEQLLQLRDAVLSDKHPHFKLPADVKQKLQSAKISIPGSSQQLPGLKTDLRNGAQVTTSTQYNGTHLNGARNTAAFDENRSSHAGQASAPKTHPSGIDPVLLTKSDDLIKAEIHLKRQRIEKQLKENVEQRRQSMRRDADAEPATLIDLPEILQKAWELVKPVSGLKPTANTQAAASDSFDENSYYSSQANDWSSQASADSKPNDAAAVDTSILDPTHQGLTGLASSASLTKHPVSANERHLDRQAHRPHISALRSPEVSFYTNDTEGAYDAEREDSEEYSPPAAEAFSAADDAMDLDDGQWYKFTSQVEAKISTDSSEFVPEEPTVPSPQATVVTNHLMHIAAPQPARVSPLAVAKVPGLSQSTPRVSAKVARAFEKAVSEESTTSPRGSAPTSPNVPSTKKQRTRQRKRKREAEAAEKTRKRREEPLVPKSPEPYIKPEPVSPPPFAEVPSIQAPKSRGPQTLPPDVEIVSPHEFRPRPRQQYYQEPPPPPQSFPYGTPVSPAVVRVESPASYGRPRRDDQDLRRVASLHAAQRPVSPVYSPVAPYRTMSQTYLDHPPRAPSTYRTEATRAPSNYIRSERSMSPPQLRAAREAYVQSPALMPPPPPPQRRIVVDQYGNKYIAAEEADPPPPVPARMSVAPHGRYEAGDVAYERAPSRASGLYHPAGAYDDSRMAPPPMRRITVQAEGEGPDYRAYRQREYSRAPEAQYYREEPVYMAPPPAPPAHRASAYPPEPAAPSGYVRAYSVRPEAEPTRYVSRAPSVMPQTEYVRMADDVGRGPAPSIRAVSVAPGPEYSREAERRRYGYGHGGPGAYPMAPPPQRIEVYVDQYGREIRRAPAYQ